MSMHSTSSKIGSVLCPSASLGIDTNNVQQVSCNGERFTLQLPSFHCKII